MPEIADRLSAELPGVRWKVEFVSDRLAEPPTDLSDLISAGRRMLLERGWHLAVCITDLPLQTARRPVIAHVSATHSVGVLSMPALGPVAVHRRAAETTVRLVRHMLGDLAPTAEPAGRLAPDRVPPPGPAPARTGQSAPSTARTTWDLPRGSSPATSGCCWA